MSPRRPSPRSPFRATLRWRHEPRGCRHRRCRAHPAGPTEGPAIVAALHGAWQRRNPRRAREGGNWPRGRRRGSGRSGPPRGRGTEPRTTGCDRGRHRLGCPRILDQQGLPLGLDSCHRCRPHGAPRRCAGRRGGGHGVDVAGTAPAHGLSRGVVVRIDRSPRPHGPRRAHRRVRPGEHGRVDRAAQRPLRGHPRGSGCRGRPLPPARRGRVGGRRLRRRDRPGGDSAAQG